MRLVLMLIALLIVGLLVYKQMGSQPPPQSEAAQSASGPDTPAVPSNPNDIQQFRSDMDKYMQQEAEKRAAAIEEAESQ